MLSEDASKARRDAEALESRCSRSWTASTNSWRSCLAGAPTELAAQRRTLNKQRDGLAASVARPVPCVHSSWRRTSSSSAPHNVRKNWARRSPRRCRLRCGARWPSAADRYRARCAVGRAGRDALVAGIRTNGWGTPLLGLLAALVMMFPLRLWLRRLGRQFAASERAGRSPAPVRLAMWLLVGTPPGYAAVVLMAALDAIDAIAPRLQAVADLRRPRSAPPSLPRSAPACWCPSARHGGC